MNDRVSWLSVAAIVVAVGCPADRQPEVIDVVDAGRSTDGSVFAASMPAAVALIEHSAWRSLELSADPYWDVERGHTPCSSADWYIEGTVEPYLELQTGACNYVTLVQPALADVRAGDVLTLALSNTNLNGTGETGRVALRIGELEIWSKEIPVRAEPASHNIAWTAPDALPAAATVAFHIENHGDNAWRFLSLTRRR